MNFYGRMPMGFSGAVSLIPLLTGLELTFVVLTGSNSGLFRALGFVFSPLGKGKRVGRKNEEKGRREKVNRKGKDGRKKE